MVAKNDHDEKVTFYCTTAQFMDIEQAVVLLRRLGLRRGIDRGAVIRTALDLTVKELLTGERQSRIYEHLTAALPDGGIPDPSLFD